MMRSFTRGIVAAVAFVVLIVGCNDGADPQSSAAPLGVVTAKTFGELPICWIGRRAQVFYVASTDEFFYCDGRRYVELEIDGSAGGGVTWVVDVGPAAPGECPNGGAQISSGPDANGDGVIDTVASSQSVCDGQDGTSCTVLRDDDTGTTTITCEDGTEAVVADGGSGPQGAPGQDGTSCSVETDAQGVVTIQCDDGTTAMIAPGGGSSDVALLCELVRINPVLVPTSDLEQQCPRAESCPCYDEDDILADIASGAVTGCVFYQRDARLITETIPSQAGANAAFEATIQSVFTPNRSFLCDTDSTTVEITTYEEYLTCATLIEDVVGPCQPAECFTATATVCEDDNPCTENSCDTTTLSCTTTPLQTGESCDLPDGSVGQCFLGNCQPVL